MGHHTISECSDLDVAADVVTGLTCPDCGDNSHLAGETPALRLGKGALSGPQAQGEVA